ncbi:DUF6636 domain-containing protein [Rhodococcus sp. NPDC058532]|uniref:DUF6636 domain-containing protein n=1 Tax=Rhodococcus sp. NPDC058532 TaxID=3346540 RepID=UPI00364CF438
MGSRRVLTVLGAVAAAALLASCGTSDADEVATPTTTVVSTTTATVPPVTSTAPATTTTVEPTTTTAAPPTTYRRNEAVYFTAPSGGFQCGIIELATRTEAGCQGTTTPVPPKPEDCMINWGSGIRVTGAGPAEFLCAGGLIYTSGEADPVLPVGESIASFGYTCTSETAGVTCRKDDTGHGFRIAAESNETF